MARYGRLVALALTAAALLAAARAQPVADLVRTTLADPAFWQTSNQTWDESNRALHSLHASGARTSPTPHALASLNGCPHTPSDVRGQ